jgi:glycosyltransferase involved in cell wall biosynthesis
MWPKEKGQDLLLNVLARERWRHRPVEVNFYGEGPMGRGLEEMKNYLKLERVHFRGFVQDISEVWRTHHALVLASRAEGLPLAQVEAMMCGRPAIMTIAGGSAEILVEGETGFIAEAQTVEALDAAMERAWQRRGDWKSIGLRAAESVRKLIPENPCEVFAEKLAEIHDAVVQRRNLNKT